MYKLENEEPRIPPQRVESNEIPRAIPTVPEVTLYSPATATEKLKSNNLKSIFTNLAKNPTQKSPKPAEFLQAPTPSVTDVSILNPNVIPRRPLNENVTVFPKPQSKIVSTNLNQENPQIMKENFLFNNKQSQIPKPMVPDVSIFDPPKKPEMKEQKKRNNLVFDENYKKYLLESHEQFMCQMREEPILPSPEVVQPKRTIFNPNTKPTYNENPLTKYASRPKPQRKQNFVAKPVEIEDGNSSSILVDVDAIIQNKPTQSEKESDEETFKKVADMLSEMQKIMGLQEKKPTEPDPQLQSDRSETDEDILWRLASRYLTKEEIQYYNVEGELKTSKDFGS